MNKIYKWHKLFIGIIFFVFSLSAYSQKNDSLKFMRFFERKLTKNIISNYCDYTNVSLKIDAKIKTEKKSYRLNILYRNIKDSAIWINVNHSTGIAVARFLITPDSTKMLNRIDNEYFVMSNNQIVKKYGYDISFNMLQAIFSAQLINLDPDKKLLKTYKHYKAYNVSDSIYLLQNIKKKKVDRLLKKDKIDTYYIHEVRINNAYKIISNLIEDNANQQKILVEYPEYAKEDYCLERMNFKLSNNKEITKIEMKIKKRKMNKETLKLPFRIPKKYTKKSIE